MFVVLTFLQPFTRYALCHFKPNAGGKMFALCMSG